MPWKEETVLEQKQSLIKDYLDDGYSIAELSRRHKISRETIYKWIERYEEEGIEGLHDRSRARHSQALQTDERLVQEILELKYRWPKWGPKKILGNLKNHQPQVEWPSVTTAHNILFKNGLVIPRKRRRRVPASTTHLSQSARPNDVWSVDFKGWRMTSDDLKCDPLTISDNYSRYLLYCGKLTHNNTDHVWAILDRIFREYGLPLYLKSDNGPPFATTGPGRLSTISIKLIKAGVTPEWIEPGKPQQNGRHERMHGTLQREGFFPNLTLIEQQKEFVNFQEYYNEQRPHEALGQKTPASIHECSPRSWNGQLRAPEYPEGYKVLKVRECGKAFLNGTNIYIGRALANEPIGLKENNENGFLVYYGPIILGNLTRELEFNIPKRKERRRTGNYDRQIKKDTK
jgi:putative transposase